MDPLPFTRAPMVLIMALSGRFLKGFDTGSTGLTKGFCKGFLAFLNSACSERVLGQSRGKGSSGF